MAATQPGRRPPAAEPATAAQDSETARSRSALRLLQRFLAMREASVIVVTILVAGYFAIETSGFLTAGNLETLPPFFAPIAILGAGEVFLMVNGEIDLSMGAVYLFAPFLFHLIDDAGVPLLVDLVLAVLACSVVGVINGLFTALIGVTSFIATLGMLLAVVGFTLIVSHAEPVIMPGSPLAAGHTTTFARIFGAGQYAELVWALGIVLVLQVVLTRARWGTYNVAIGDNRLAAEEAGIPVRLIVIRNFVLCSACAAFVGILEAMRTSSINPDPSGASAILFDGISAAVIGGTLLAGGSGSVVGALIGALFLGILRDGLTIEGVNADYLTFYLGAAIIVAMAVNMYVARARRGLGGAG